MTPMEEFQALQAAARGVFLTWLWFRSVVWLGTMPNIIRGPMPRLHVFGVLMPEFVVAWTAFFALCFAVVWPVLLFGDFLSLLNPF